MSKFIPYSCQNISEEDIKAVVDALKKPMITQGPTVEAFEKGIAKYVGASYSVAMNSATSALHLACKALGLKKGDILWTTPNTFVASANCARYCNAEVDFVDISPNTGLMSVNKLKLKLKEAERSGKLPKIIIPVHFAGSSCDMQTINQLALKYGFSVIEDASHAIGGEYQGFPVGDCRFSNIVVFSFHPVKIITTAEGGLATTNDPKLAQKMFDLRSHGITKDYKRFEYSNASPWMYEQQNLGFNFRMNDLQAALGLSQLKRLKDIVRERNTLFNRYKELLQQIPVDLLEIPSEVLSSVHLAVIKLRTKSCGFYKNVFEGLRNSEIGVQLHYLPVHLHPYYRRLGFKVGDFPVAESHALSAISLPLYPNLKIIQQEYVIEKLSEQILKASEKIK